MEQENVLLLEWEVAGRKREAHSLSLFLFLSFTHKNSHTHSIYLRTQTLHTLYLHFSIKNTLALSYIHILSIPHTSRYLHQHSTHWVYLHFSIMYTLPLSHTHTIHISVAQVDIGSHNHSPLPRQYLNHNTFTHTLSHAQTYLHMRTIYRRVTLCNTFIGSHPVCYIGTYLLDVSISSCSQSEAVERGKE